MSAIATQCVTDLSIVCVRGVLECLPELMCSPLLLVSVCLLVPVNVCVCVCVCPPAFLSRCAGSRVCVRAGESHTVQEVMLLPQRLSLTGSSAALLITHCLYVIRMGT